MQISSIFCFFPDSAESCVTVGGPDQGANCVFPFTYQSTVFYGCTLAGNDDGDDKPWCSTKTDQQGNHVGGGQGNWGHCPSNCGNGRLAHYI